MTSGVLERQQRRCGLLARANLQNNPHVVAYWFHFRFKTLKEMVLEKKVRIVDAWDRYEWQGRGSTHNHGVFWREAAPSPEVEQVDDATYMILVQNSLIGASGDCLARTEPLGTSAGNRSAPRRAVTGWVRT
jgi:ATP-dependent DNA helicase PIF1